MYSSKLPSFYLNRVVNKITESCCGHENQQIRYKYLNPTLMAIESHDFIIIITLQLLEV